MPYRTLALAAALATLASVAACGRGAAGTQTTAPPVSAAAASAPPARTATPSAPPEIGRRLLGQLGAAPAGAAATDQQKRGDDLLGALTSLASAAANSSSKDAAKDAQEDEPEGLPAGLVPDGTCGDAPAAESDPGVAGTGASPIPMIEGLTLSQTWIPSAGDYEHECLVQVTKIDARGIDVTRSCPVGASRRTQVDHRRICLADVAAARLYAPGTSQQTPTVMGGTTLFSLSRLSFRELKETGKTADRFVHVKAGELRLNLPGTLTRGPVSTYRIIVNDRAVDLPVITVAGSLGTDGAIHPRGVVLNDDRFPLLLDFGWDDYTVRFTKISFPAASALESSLDKERRVDVYGIYFDFASDALRAESEPVLQEIAAVLAKNPAWTLSINGHTDNVGGDKFNLELSRRRSDAVRRALIDRFGIDPARLATSGAGASQPKDTNDTIEGRARNRRVELVRR